VFGYGAVLGLDRLADLHNGEAPMIRGRNRTILFLVCFLLSAGRLCAQEISLGGRLGMVGGAVWFEDEEANDMQEPRLGLQVGGVAAYNATPFLSVQTELWYVQKGWVESPSGGARRLGYLEIPLFVVGMAPWRTTPQVVAGASVSREVSCSVGGIPGVGSLSCEDSRVEWRRNKEQFGIWFGLGVRRRFAASTLDVQFLGNFHLTDLERDPLPPGDSRLFSAMLSATYTLPVGGSRR
jgi:hypothetical protein